MRGSMLRLLVPCQPSGLGHSSSTVLSSLPTYYPLLTSHLLILAYIIYLIQRNILLKIKQLLFIDAESTSVQSEDDNGIVAILLSQLDGPDILNPAILLDQHPLVQEKLYHVQSACSAAPSRAVLPYRSALGAWTLAPASSSLWEISM
jgi:hypothetical protein